MEAKDMRVLERLGAVCSAACFGALLAGCGAPPASLHPLYTEHDNYSDQRLAGAWVDTDTNKDTVKFFSRPGEKAYTLIVREAETSAVATFRAQLVRLDQTVFMDTFLESIEPDRCISLPAAVHMIPGHVFSRLAVQDDLLRVTPMDGDWLKDALNSRQVQIRHEVYDQGGDDHEVFLTAKTAELREFVAEHEDQAFPSKNIITLHRRKR
jgi:hypothetical protein